MLCLFRSRIATSSTSTSFTTLRALSTSQPCLLKAMPPRPPLLPEDSFTEAFLCGTGPGGQKINKTSSAVQLKHLATGIVLKVQATRSRSQNRKIAREMLALRVQDLECKASRENGEKDEKGKELNLKSRLEVVTETKIKKKKSGDKKRKRKYKALAEEKERAEAEAEVDARDGAEPKMP